MSIEIHTFLDHKDLPPSTGWSAAAQASGFNLAFVDFNPLEDSGFVPCIWQEIKTGFEFFLAAAEDVADSYPDLKGHTQSYDSVATFTTSSDLRELASSIVAAATLAALSDGVLFDPQEAVLHKGSAALDYARAVLRKISG